MNVADTEIDGRRPRRQGRPDPGGTGEPLTVGSLFAGIGGFDLGFERAGMRTVWFCEQDEFCRAVLAKHWPGVPCYPDVRALVADSNGQGFNGGRVRRDAGGRGVAANGNSGGDVPVPVPYVDVLCGGFPCQDLSVAGKGAGIDGQRSGLWGEYARLIRELRPRYVVVENVAALLGRGLGRVLGDLAACGYDAEWDCVPASAVGAPHRRDRLWIVGYPNEAGLEGHRGHDQRAGERAAGSAGVEPAGAVADPAGEGRQPRRPAGEALPRPEEVERFGRCGGGERCHWEFEPAVGRVANGVPNRVDRLAALGNSLVPQIAEWLGRRIVETEERG